MLILTLYYKMLGWGLHVALVAMGLWRGDV